MYKIFSILKDVNKNEELINKGLILKDFEIWNLGDEDIQIIINYSDCAITLESGEGFSMGKDETRSCIMASNGKIKMVGKH